MDQKYEKWKRQIKLEAAPTRQPAFELVQQLITTIGGVVMGYVIVQWMTGFKL